jgi:ankyrin repeat protein
MSPLHTSKKEKVTQSSLLLTNPDLTEPSTRKDNNNFFYPQPIYGANIYQNKVFKNTFYPPLNIPVKGNIVTEKSLRHQEYLWFKTVFADSCNPQAKIVDQCLKLYFKENDQPELQKLLSACNKINKQIKNENYKFLIWYSEVLRLAGKKKKTIEVNKNLSMIFKKKQVPIFHQFINLLNQSQKLPKSYRRKALAMLSEYLQQNKLEREKYVLILRQIRRFKNTQDTWEQLYKNLRNNNVIPEWFKLIITGNHEINLVKDARLKALKLRWTKNFKNENIYWKKFERHNQKAAELFQKAWFIFPNCPEAALGMLKVCRPQCETAQNFINNISGWFNIAVQCQADFIPAYLVLLKALRSTAYAETRIMKCAETALKTGLFDTRVPDMYLFGLILAASDYRFAWQATFRRQRVINNLEYYFCSKLKSASNLKEKKLLLARQAQMYRLCGLYQKVKEILKELPADYPLEKACNGLYFGYNFAVLKRNRQQIESEITAYTGSSNNLLTQADIAIQKGCGLLTEEFLKLALRQEKNVKAKSYILTRLAMRSAGRDTEYNTIPQDLILYCASKFRFNVIDTFAKYGLDFNQVTSSGRYTLSALLHKKNKSGDYSRLTKMVKLLIKHGATLNSRDRYHNTPLHYAVANKKSWEITNTLINNKANINALNGTGKTPLLLACKSGNIQTAYCLIQQKNIDINHAGRNGYTALMYAAYKTTPFLIGELLRHNAQINYASKSGWTALGLACYYKKLANAQILIKAGANVNSGSGTVSPLVMAVCRNQYETVKKLLENGADPCLKNKYGKNAFSYIKPKQKKISNLLISYSPKRR